MDRGSPINFLIFQMDHDPAQHSLSSVSMYESSYINNFSTFPQSELKILTLLNKNPNCF